MSKSGSVGGRVKESGRKVTTKQERERERERG